MASDAPGPSRRRWWRAALGIFAGLVLAAALVAVSLLRGRKPPEPPLRTRCQPGETTPGIDVSYYQEAIDWPRVRRAGIRFAFIRVSDGATVRDVKFAANWAGAKRAGVRRGAYQYFRPDQDVAAQADLLVSSLRGFDRDDLPPVLDIETDAGLPAREVAARARRWIDRVRAELAVEPIVYTGSDLWRGGGARKLARQPLWIAHYTHGCPTIPSDWPRWTFWQHTDRGAVPGIDGAVDLDVFFGSPEQLSELR